MAAVTTAGDGQESVAVRYRDLNVDSERGARVLLERIQFAAGEVCPFADDRDPERLVAPPITAIEQRVELGEGCVEQAHDRMPLANHPSRAFHHALLDDR